MTDIEYLKKYLPSSKLEEGLNLLKKNVPVQYIVGNVDFYGNIIKVDKRVLIPRNETEELVEYAIKKINKYTLNPKILEIGTGSGCISIALKKQIEESYIVATDISNDALELARLNAKANNTKIKFVNTDIYNNINEKFDCIISNPPYISKSEKIMDKVYNNEPHLALFAPNNGLYFYEKILKDCKKVLNTKFLICFEIGQTQANNIKTIINKYLENVKIEVINDLTGVNRFIFITNFE